MIDPNDSDPTAKCKIQGKSMTCELCSKSFLRKDRFKAHVRHHTQTKEESHFQCDICKRFFTRKDVLTLHIRQHFFSKTHKPQILHICTICDKNFNRSQDLGSHNRLFHTGNRTFLCEVCGLLFVMETQLIYHQKTHRPELKYLIVCQICDKTFTAEEYLILHERVHGDREKQQFNCDACNKTYTKKEHLKKHFRSKTHLRYKET